MADYKKIIRDEIEYQRNRLYKRLKTSDDGRLIIEYWKGADHFLNAVHGIDWHTQGTKILITEKKNTMKTFRDILKENVNDDADLEFVLMQFQNDDASTDKAMIKHLENQTGFSRKQIQKLVRSGREKILAKPLISIDDGIELLRKFL